MRSFILTDRHWPWGTEKITKSDRIYAHPFAPTHTRYTILVHGNKKIWKPSKPLIPEEYEIGRELGALIAKELMTEINRMGVVALEDRKQSLPQPNDLMIIGYFEGVEEGSTVKRLGLGFGSRAAELWTAVKGYQMTNTGPRLLGTGKLDSGGRKCQACLSQLRFSPPLATRSA